MRTSVRAGRLAQGADSWAPPPCLPQVLAKHPRYLNRFYKEESQFTLTWRNHGRPDTRETVSTTQVGARSTPSCTPASLISPSV